MNNSEISNTLFDSVQVLIDASLSRVNYDRTLKYTIKDNSKKDQGIYRVTDGEIEFEARTTSVEEEYKNDDEVYVTITQGDFSNDKIIVGRYIENEENRPLSYIAPDELLVLDYETSLSGKGLIADGSWMSNSQKEEDDLNNKISLLQTLQTEALNEIDEKNYRTKKAYENKVKEITDYFQGLIQQCTNQISSSINYMETQKVGFKFFNNYTSSYIENDYTCLVLSCDFLNNLKDYNVVSGNYGINIGVLTSDKPVNATNKKVTIPDNIKNVESLIELQKEIFIQNPSNTTNPHFALSHYSFDSSDMIGNLYNYTQSINQSVMVDISALQNIVGIFVEVYQCNNFKAQGLTEVIPLHEAYKNRYNLTSIPIANTKHEFFTKEKDNIKLEQVYLKFGYNQQQIEENTFLLYTQNSLEFKPAGTSLDENKKNIKAKWFYKNEETDKIETLNDLNDKDNYQVYWYKSSYEVGDEHAGFGWTLVEDDEGQVGSTDMFDFVYTPITDLSETSVKAVLLKKQDNGSWKAIAQSSILTFRNKDMTSNASGIVYLEILDEQKEFYIYGEDYKIINYEDFNKTRTLKATIPETRLGFKKMRIDWIIPRGATMLLDPRDDSEEDKTKNKYKQYDLGANVEYKYGNSEYCVITKLYELENKDDPVPEKWFKQSFGIQEFYNNTYMRNQITCRVFYDDEYNEYFDEGRINLKFGQTSNNGTNYNFSLLFEDIDHPYVTYNENDEKFEISNGGILTLVPYFSAKNYELTEPEIKIAKSSIKYEWYYKFPSGYSSPLSFQKYDDGSGKCLIKINENSQISYAKFATMISNTIKATAKINGVNIEAFCSIPIRRLNISTSKASDPKGIQAPGIITYSSQGGEAQYSTAPLKLYGNVGGHVSEDLSFFIGNPKTYDNSYLTDLHNEFIYSFSSMSSLSNNEKVKTFYCDNSASASMVTKAYLHPGTEDEKDNGKITITESYTQHIKEANLVSNQFTVGESYTFTAVEGRYAGTQLSSIYLGEGQFYIIEVLSVPILGMNLPQNVTWYSSGYTRWESNGYKVHLFHGGLQTSDKFILSSNPNLAGYYALYGDGKEQVNYGINLTFKCTLPTKGGKYALTDLTPSLFGENRLYSKRRGKYFYLVTKAEGHSITFRNDETNKYYQCNSQGKFLIPEYRKNESLGRITLQAEGQKIKIVLRGSNISDNKSNLNTYFNRIVTNHLNAEPTIILKTVPFSKRTENTGVEQECLVIKENNKYIQEKDGEIYLIVSNNTIRTGQQYYLYSYGYDYSDSKNFTTLKGGVDVPVVWKLTKLYKPKGGEWTKQEVGDSGISEIGDPEVAINKEQTGLWYFRPYPMYITTDTFYQLEAYFEYATNKNYLIWMQPIVIRQNKYFEPILNAWNGTTTEMTDTHILSPAIGAGSKNGSNQFSGVFMGKVGKNIEDTGAKHGLYGFHNGAQSFGFKEDGTAFIGKSGTGRIEFDGSKGTITSKSYSIDETGVNPQPQRGAYLDLDEGYLGIKTIDQSYYNGTVPTQGIIIAHRPQRNADGTLPSKKSLLNIGPEHQFIQSANYSSDLNTGMKIDLNNGKITGYSANLSFFESGGGAGTVSISSSNTKYPIKVSNNATAPQEKKEFTVGWDGVLRATGAIINGQIEATEGSIGGWKIIGNTLTSLNDLSATSNGIVLSPTNTWVIEVGENKTRDFTSVGGNKNKYRALLISKTGGIWAEDAHIKGQIYTNKGIIGGWEINSDGLNNSHNADATVKKDDALFDKVKFISTCFLRNDCLLWKGKHSINGSSYTNVPTYNSKFEVDTSHGKLMQFGVLGYEANSGKIHHGPRMGLKIWNKNGNMSIRTNDETHVNGNTSFLIETRGYRKTWHGSGETDYYAAWDSGADLILQHLGHKADSKAGRKTKIRSQIRLTDEGVRFFGALFSNDTSATTSDITKKNSISPINEKFDIFFDNIKAIQYKYNHGESDRYHTGFIAQQIKESLDIAKIPTQDFAGLVINYRGTDREEWYLRYSEFVSLNTWQIQLAKKRISDLEAQIEVLTKKLDKIISI